MSSVLAPWLPTLLVIDDLHWADSAALAMVRYLARDHRLDGLVIAVTARPIGPQPRSATAVLVELGRYVETERIELDGLDEQELTALVSDVIGAPAPAANSSDRSPSATEGNPFFAEELTVHLIDTGAVVDTVDGVAVRATYRGRRAEPRSRHRRRTAAIVVVRRHDAACRSAP